MDNYSKYKNEQFKKLVRDAVLDESFWSDFLNRCYGLTLIHRKAIEDSAVRASLMLQQIQVDAQAVICDSTNLMVQQVKVDSQAAINEIVTQVDQKLKTFSIKLYNQRILLKRINHLEQSNLFLKMVIAGLVLSFGVVVIVQKRS